MLKIVVGNKKYSSWSLRGWLALELTGAPYEEIVVPLDMDDTAANIRRYSPSGRVPAIIDGSITVWDSLAIGEYLHEKFPQAQLWPQDAAQRAHARSISAEMHSGFASLREECPMKIVEQDPPRELSAPTKGDVERIREIWSECLTKNGGPFLFGKRICLADVMYAPVVTRFRTYAIPAEGAVKAYLETIWGHPALQKWVATARAETLRAKFHEP
jgi:glutathione S-transferase